MTNEAIRVAIYARVSVNERTVENQLRELHAVAGRHGWNVFAIFKDQGISGAKGRDQRPGLDKLLKAITRREVDLIAAWSVDRLGRSLPHLLTILEEIHAKDCNLYCHQQGLDTRTPAGKAMFQMMGVFAEFERAMIRERVNAGLARAKAQGKQLGRRRNDDADRLAEIKRLRHEGMGMNKIARTLGCGACRWCSASSPRRYSDEVPLDQFQIIDDWPLEQRVRGKAGAPAAREDGLPS